MSTGNRRERFTRWTVIVLVLLVALTMMGSLIAPALAAPGRTASPAPSPAVATPAAESTARPAALAAAPDQTAAQPPSQRRPRTRPLLFLGTHDLTWADVLAAAVEDPYQPREVQDAARLLLAMASQGQPVNLVTRTVSDTTCPADGWLSLGAATRASAGPRSAEGKCLWPQYLPDGPRPTRSTGLGVLHQAQEATNGSSGAVGRGAKLALTNRTGRSPNMLTLTELTEGDQLPDLVLVDTADPTVIPQLLPPTMRAGLAPYDLDDGAADASDASQPDLSGTSELPRDSFRVFSPSSLDPTQTTDAQRLVALASTVRILRQHNVDARVIIASVADASSPGPQMALFPADSYDLNSQSLGTTDRTVADLQLLVPSSTHQPGLLELTDLAPILARGVDNTITFSPDYPFKTAPVELGGPEAPATTTTPTDDARGRVKAAALADAALHGRASRLATVPTSLLLMVLAGVSVIGMALLLRTRTQAPTPQAALVPAGHPRDAGPAPQDVTSQPAPARPEDDGARDTSAEPESPSGSQPSSQDVTPQPAPAHPRLEGAAADSSRPSDGRLRLAAVLGLVALLTPVGALSTNLLPWWRVGATGEIPSWTAVGAALAGTLALTLAAALPLLVLTVVLKLAAQPLLRRRQQHQEAWPARHYHRDGAEAWGWALTAATAVAALLVLAWTIFEGALVDRLALNSPLGMNTVVAGRYYGVNNTSFALGAGALLVAVMALWALLRPAVTAWAGRARRHRRGLPPTLGSPADADPTHVDLAGSATASGVPADQEPATAPPTEKAGLHPAAAGPADQPPASTPSGRPWVLASLLLVLPLGLATLFAELLGTDGGGSLTLVPVLFVLGMGLAGRQIRWRHWLALLGLMMLPVLLLAAMDLHFGEPETHLGRFLEMAQRGEAKEVLDRKAWAIVAPFFTGWLPLLALIVGLGLVVATVRQVLRALRQARQGQGAYAWVRSVYNEPPAGLQAPAARPWGWLPVALRTALVLLVVEVLLNDSGLVMAWFSIVSLLPGLLALASAQLLYLPHRRD